MAGPLRDEAGAELVRVGGLSAAEFMHMSRGVPLIFGEDHESHDVRVPIDGDRDGPGHVDNTAEE
jgi:hypothetical protein